MGDFIKFIHDEVGYPLKPYQIAVINKIVEGKDMTIYPGLKCAPNKWCEALKERLAELESKKNG